MVTSRGVEAVARGRAARAPSSTVEVRWSESPADREGAFGVRRAVFMDEQGYTEEQEFDAADARAMHALALADGEVVGTARLVLERDDLGQAAVVGRVAVLPPHRGRGVGSALVAFVVRNAAVMGPYVVLAGAQVRALGFWERLGFQRTGEGYMDFHVPHEWMELRLDRR
jgi:predicted GNAT family N-acyltransferase